MNKYCEYCKNDERHRKIKLIISIEKDLYEMIKDCVEHGQNYDYFEIIANGIPYEERQHGRWIKVKEDRMSIDMSGEIVTRYKCSKCRRVIATFPSKLVDYYPFCHCGADMRGKEE